jgi:cytoskeletal protein CcmA (bactofilin family)
MKSPLTPVVTLIAASLILTGCQDETRSNIGKRVVLPADEVHEGWYFASGDQVVLLGTVQGDVYVAGGEVQIDGDINGDLLVAGGNVSISGTVSDDVRAAGGNVECSGNIGKNMTVAGGNIHLSKSGVINGGIIAAGGDIRISGTVKNHVLATGGRAQVGGRVEGNMQFAGGQITTLPGAEIHGDLQARVDKADQAMIAPGTVNGSVEITTKKPEARGTILGFGAGHFWFKIFWALSLIVTAIVMILLSRRFVDRLGQVIWQHPGWSLLWGFVGVIATPIIVLVLFLTLAGLPLGIFLLVLYFWALYISQMALGIVVGQRVFLPESKGRLMLASIAGLVLVQVLTFVPYLGILIITSGVLLGVGGIIEVIRQNYVSSTPKMSPPIA